MSSRSDPLSTLRRRIRSTWAAGAIVAGASAWWALRPVDAAETTGLETAASAPSSAPAPASDPFDARAFEARIWSSWRKGSAESAARAQVDAAAGAAATLQLVGITEENGALLAALYDPKEDRLWIVRSGDRVGARTVGRITKRSVELGEGEASLCLSLARLDR